MQSSTYGTLFNFSRTEDSPLVDLTVNKGRIPSQPQPVPIGPSSFRSWFQSNRTMSGQQIDELCRYRLWDLVARSLIRIDQWGVHTDLNLSCELETCCRRKISRIQWQVWALRLQQLFSQICIANW